MVPAGIIAMNLCYFHTLSLQNLLCGSNKLLFLRRDALKKITLRQKRPLILQLIYNMKQKTIQWLLAAGLLVCSAAVWAQPVPVADSPVLLEISDINGDKQTVPITDGMTLYWPQALLQDNAGHQRAYAVLCDKNNVPQFRFPVGRSDLSILRFLNAPAASVPADMSSYQGTDEQLNQLQWGNFPTGLRFDIGGSKYAIPHPGEFHFSSPTGTYELVTAEGQRLMIPMANTDMIHYQDTLQGMASYLNTMLSEQASIYEWAFFNGIDGLNNKLHEDFYAMIPSGSTTNISLLAPSNEAFSFVPYIISYTSRQPSVFKIIWRGKASFPFSTGKILYPYDFQTGEVSENSYNIDQITENQLSSYLSHMLYSHTIMHRDENREKGLNSGNEFYVALDGSPIRVIREDGQIVGFQSAYHLWNQQRGLTAMSGGSTASLTKADITKQRSKENGTIYCIDNTLDAAPSSVYSILSGNDPATGATNPFERFFELCRMSGVFVHNGGIDDLGLDFIGNIPFTLYVPTNEAVMQEMGAAMSEIEGYEKQLEETEDAATLEALRNQIAVKQKPLQAFVKAHIHFGIEIADQLPFQREHNTMLVKNGTLTTPKLDVRGLGNGQMTVTDECGNTRHIVDARKNIFVREAHCINDRNGTGDGTVTTPQGKSHLDYVVVGSYANGVIHQIDGVLRHNP